MVVRLLITLALILPSTLCWAGAYYWVDDQGKRHYSDRVPPKETKRERKVINDRGFTVSTLPAQKTAEEHKLKLEAQATAERERDEAHQKKTEQITYDTLLLTTYENVTAIERVRDDRLSLIDASILVTVQAHADNHKRLIALRGEEKMHLDAGNPVPNKLRKNLQDVIDRIKSNELNIQELQRQRSATNDQYQQDINRFTALKSAAN